MLGYHLLATQHLGLVLGEVGPDILLPGRGELAVRKSEMKA